MLPIDGVMDGHALVVIGKSYEGSRGQPAVFRIDGMPDKT